jgi:hypothetical protein
MIASLGLVAYEIRQNTQAVAGQTLQALAQQQVDLAMIGVESPELREAYELAFDDPDAQLTQEQRRILRWFYTGVMRVTENRYRQYQIQTLSEHALLQFGAEGNLFRSAFFKAWWQGAKGQFSEDFASWVELTLVPLETTHFRETVR